MNEFIKEIQKYDLNDGNFCIAITGHTDRVPFKKAANKNNQQLSLERANAIKKYIDQPSEDQRGKHKNCREWRNRLYT